MATGTYKIDLSKIWLFASCSGKEINSIRRELQAEMAPPGKVLTQEGDIGRDFYLVVAGMASVRRKGRRVATIGPDEYFGELALLDQRPRSATVTAESDMELLVLGQRAFIGVVESVPSLSRKLLATMATRLRESDAKAFQ
jgi:CRP/FNR family cyclic AMP-dependent transcriptional regulator